MKKERYAYLILAILSLFCGAMAVFISAKDISSNNRKFCDIIHAVVSVPVTKPTNPAADPSREKDYEWYERYYSLGQNLGCF